MKVAFYKGNCSLLDKLVRLVTCSRFSHCELVFSDGLLCSDGWMFGAAPGEGARYKHLSAIDCDDYEFVTVPISALDELAISLFCRDEEGDGYDYPGVFRFLLPWVSESPDKWFCSELCAAALRYGGKLPGVVPSRVTPGQLHKLLTEGVEWPSPW